MPLARRVIQFKSGQFVFFTTQKSRFFGTQIVWKGDQKILMSDIHKTIVDIILNPSWGGGIAHVFDCLKNYLKHEEANLNKLMEYAENLRIKAFFNRFGFYIEQILGTNNEVTIKCRNKIRSGSGYHYLDTKNKGNRYLASWKIIVPTDLNLGKNE